MSIVHSVGVIAQVHLAGPMFQIPPQRPQPARTPASLSHLQALSEPLPKGQDPRGHLVSLDLLSLQPIQD